MNQHEAEALLGLTPGEATSVRAVRAAFSRSVRLCHPDTAENGGASHAPIGNTIGQMQAARDLLLAHLNGLNLCCKLCGGSGTVRGRLGRTECVTCNGTGDKQ